VLSGITFYHIEKRAKEPILSIQFFNVPGFSIGNASMFFSCFAYYSLAAFLPLFVQGALEKTPAQMGIAMVPLSLGWSVGALLCGYVINRAGSRSCAIIGALSLMAGCCLFLTFTADTSLTTCFLPFTLSGFGMGFVSISTLLMVQNSLEASDLGVATASHQFTRTLSGTIGMGISGSLVTARIAKGIDTLVNSEPKGMLPLSVANRFRENIDNLFQPDIQSILTPLSQKLLHGVIANSVMMVFWAAVVAAVLCLLFSYFLPKK
jgi:predicted MFS family arabinose efflux permease